MTTTWWRWAGEKHVDDPPGELTVFKFEQGKDDSFRLTVYTERGILWNRWDLESVLDAIKYGRWVALDQCLARRTALSGRA